MSKIKVILVEPGKIAEVREIGSSLEELQKTVGGFIETCYLFPDENLCLVCNDSGKFNGMRPNRAVRNEDGTVSDILFGPFFLCGIEGDHFASLNEEQLTLCLEQFFCPERFVVIDGKIYAETYFPKVNLKNLSTNL